MLRAFRPHSCSTTGVHWKNQHAGRQTVHYPALIVWDIGWLVLFYILKKKHCRKLQKPKKIWNFCKYLLISILQKHTSIPCEHIFICWYCKNARFFLNIALLCSFYSFWVFATEKVMLKSFEAFCNNKQLDKINKWDAIPLFFSANSAASQRLPAAASWSRKVQLLSHLSPSTRGHLTLTGLL